METKDFQHLLFDGAVCMMACDGEIHEDEIAEIRKIIAHSPYFREIEAERRLEENVTRLRKEGKAFVRAFLGKLGAAGLDVVQKMLVIEVLLRIVHADQKVEENERHFLSLVRRHLSLSDEILAQRFGQDDLLHLQEMIDLDASGLNFDRFTFQSDQVFSDIVVGGKADKSVEPS